MRTLGWIFLLSYLFDAVISWIATFLPDFTWASNQISMVVAAFTVFAFVMALVGTFRPRWIFLALSCFYFVMMLFGTVAVVLLVVQQGPQQAQQLELDPAVLSQAFPWFEPIHITMLSIWFCLAIVGLFVYGRSLQPVAADVVTDPVAG